MKNPFPNDEWPNPKDKEVYLKTVKKIRAAIKRSLKRGKDKRVFKIP